MSASIFTNSKLIHPFRQHGRPVTPFSIDTIIVPITKKMYMMQKPVTAKWPPVLPSEQGEATKHRNKKIPNPKIATM